MILQKGKCDQSSRCPASWRSKCTGHAHGRHLREMDVEEGECGCEKRKGEGVGI